MERESWLSAHQQIGSLVLGEFTAPRGKSRARWVTWTCLCGATGESRWADLKIAACDGEPHSCKVCAMRRRMAGMKGTQALADHLARMREAAQRTVAANAASSAEKVLRSWATGARHRCANPESSGFKNYGGRGVEFRFTSIKAAADWVVAELGFRPSASHSIDRIDGNGHYEPGNLRWATRAEQSANRRAYSFSPVGDRVLRLQRAGADFGAEALRGFIKQGLSDEQILQRKRTSSGRPRLRHRKLWP